MTDIAITSHSLVCVTERRKILLKAQYICLFAAIFALLMPPQKKCAVGVVNIVSSVAFHISAGYGICFIS